mmetsp:Transcript_20299/g.39811  ORF Transcript_20299/g.39811 Transcript_20299/m.39811 type:complete len:287 (-) Transcript_20299:176-1036(-)
MVTKQTPFSPRVRIIELHPENFSNKACTASFPLFVSTRPTSQPRSCAASSSFMHSTSASWQSSRRTGSYGSGGTGATLRIFKEPPSSARRNASNEICMSASSWQSTTSAVASCSVAARTLLTEIVELAPGATTMVFWPLGSTITEEKPVGKVSSVLTKEQSTPALTRASSVASPRASAPTRLINDTFPGPRRRLAWTAWLAPLPPKSSLVDVLRIVSPRDGSRGTCNLQSTTLMPKTATKGPPSKVTYSLDIGSPSTTMSSSLVDNHLLEATALGHVRGKWVTPTN